MQSQLLHNQWFGKAVGLVCAFIFAPHDSTALSLAVILGIGAGHLFDLWAAHMAHTVASAAQSQQPTLDAFHLFVFASMGCIAKTAGTVTRGHIQQAEALMRSNGFNANQKRAAIDAFDLGKQGKAAVARYADPVRAYLQAQPSEKPRLLQALARAASKNPTDAALAALVDIAQSVGISSQQTARAFGDALHVSEEDIPNPQKQSRSRASTEQASADVKPDAAVTRALAVLAVSPQADLKAVKLAYRRAVSRHHPDKLPASASRKTVRDAEAKMNELRDALETLEAALKK